MKQQKTVYEVSRSAFKHQSEYFKGYGVAQEWVAVIVVRPASESDTAEYEKCLGGSDAAPKDVELHVYADEKGDEIRGANLVIGPVLLGYVAPDCIMVK